MNAPPTESSWVHSLAVTYAVLSTIFSIVRAILCYVVFYPLAWLLAGIWYILAFLSRPFVYIGAVIVNILLVPWRIFASFEPLWYFLGSAVLIGLIAALILHFTLRVFVFVLRLDKKPPPALVLPKGHDAVSYRKAREGRKRKNLEEQQIRATQARLLASQPLLQDAVREARRMPLTVTVPPSPLSPVSPFNTAPERPGLLTETILEHSEEDDDDSVF